LERRRRDKSPSLDSLERGETSELLSVELNELDELDLLDLLDLLVEEEERTWLWLSSLISSWTCLCTLLRAASWLPGAASERSWSSPSMAPKESEADESSSSTAGA
jgi:hypothetical protein